MLYERFAKSRLLSTFACSADEALTSMMCCEFGRGIAASLRGVNRWSLKTEGKQLAVNSCVCFYSYFALAHRHWKATQLSLINLVSWWFDALLSSQVLAKEWIFNHKKNHSWCNENASRIVITWRWATNRSQAHTNCLIHWHSSAGILYNYL